MQIQAGSPLRFGRLAIWSDTTNPANPATCRIEWTPDLIEVGKWNSREARTVYLNGLKLGESELLYHFERDGAYKVFRNPEHTQANLKYIFNAPAEIGGLDTSKADPNVSNTDLKVKPEFFEPFGGIVQYFEKHLKQKVLEAIQAKIQYSARVEEIRFGE
ncbi:MAG TPA: hypothetical protein V6C52_13480 [Coleofasciculaceae cyanobacterium]|jgi:hypothetical protein